VSTAPPSWITNVCSTRKVALLPDGVNRDEQARLDEPGLLEPSFVVEAA